MARSIQSCPPVLGLIRGVNQSLQVQGWINNTESIKTAFGKINIENILIKKEKEHPSENKN